MSYTRTTLILENASLQKEVVALREYRKKLEAQLAEERFYIQELENMADSQSLQKAHFALKQWKEKGRLDTAARKEAKTP